MFSMPYVSNSSPFMHELRAKDAELQREDEELFAREKS